MTKNEQNNVSQKKKCKNSVKTERKTIDQKTLRLALRLALHTQDLC